MNLLLIIFFINWVLNILAIEFFCIRKMKNIIKIDEQRDSKYYAFRRPDTFWMSRLWLYPTCHLAILKIVLAFLSIFMCAFGMHICTIGIKSDDKIIGVRYYLMRIISYITGKVVMFCAVGLVWIFDYKPEDVSYKKYLGNDWKPDWNDKSCGSVVSNHNSFLDACIHGAV